MKKKKLTKKDRLLRRQSIQRILDEKDELVRNAKILPTPEFLDKFDVEEKQTERAGERRMYVTNQLWIDTYYKKGIIDYSQHLTAQKLLSLFRRAGRHQKVTMTFAKEPVLKGSERGLNLDEGAFSDYNKLRSLMGRNSFSICQDVVCFNLSAKEWAEKNRRNVKASAELFRISLDDLADAFKELKL